MFLRCRRFLPTLALAGLASLGSTPALAGADGGAFAIKGIGATECAVAEREYKNGTPNAMMYGGWIYGYLTALNQTTPGTFDFAPWQDLNTLTNFVVEYCRKNPKTTFSEAVFKMANAMGPQRLTARTEYRPHKVNGRTFVLYDATLERIAAKLASKGHMKARPAGAKPEYNDELVRAMKAFQQSRKLKPTGEPDQMTLFELLQR